MSRTSGYRETCHHPRLCRTRRDERVVAAHEVIHVQIQPVDALDLQRDVLIKDIADAARYRHHNLRSTVRPIRGHLPPQAANDGKHAPRVTRDRSPPATPLVGLGRTPASVGWCDSGPAALLEREFRLRSVTVIRRVLGRSTWWVAWHRGSPRRCLRQSVGQVVSWVTTGTRPSVRLIGIPAGIRALVASRDGERVRVHSRGGAFG